jgi:hypothetical protein
MLPEADHLPAARGLNSDEDRDKERADAQECGRESIARETATFKGAEQRIKLYLPALVNEWRALAANLLSWRGITSIMSCQPASDQEHDEQEGERDGGRAREQRSLNLQALPEEIASAQRGEPA